MTDHNPALHARDSYPQWNAPQFICMNLTRFMQMNINSDTSFCHNAEDNINLTIRIAIQSCRINSADNFGAFINDSIQKICRTRSWLQHRPKERRQAEYQQYHATSRKLP